MNSEKRNSMKYAKDFIRSHKKITMVTCYDFTFAKILEESSVDSILVGDSLGMVVYGHDDTLGVDVDTMAKHTAAVRNGARSKFIIADMPFLSARKGMTFAMEAAHKLMSAGASAIKIEGVIGQEEILKALVNAGIPVMGHLGLTPQYYQSLGGFRVQGKQAEVHQEILRQAKILEALGIFSIVLECVPNKLAKEIHQHLEIPIIGIGAGQEVDGQVLVLHDLLGLSGANFKFIKEFSDLKTKTLEGISSYISEVNQELFPSDKESFQ